MDSKDKKSSVVEGGWLGAERSLMKLLKNFSAWLPFNSALHVWSQNEKLVMVECWQTASNAKMNWDALKDWVKHTLQD